MSPTVARVSVKGQLTIPKSVRKTLDIATGDWVLFEEKSGAIVIRKLLKIDVAWNTGVQSTLGEWADGLDDDLSLFSSVLS